MSRSSLDPDLVTVVKTVKRYLPRFQREFRKHKIQLDPAQRKKLFALLLFLAALGLVGWYVVSFLQARAQSKFPAPKAEDPRGYLFCFWNVENLFDDKLEEHPMAPDREYDSWFAKDAAARKEKYGNLSKAMTELNGGRGPDILAVAEVESLRAAEMLRDALNARLKEGVPPYKDVQWKDPHGGRHIATAVISRLPLIASKTRLHGRRLRILETHVEVNGHDLTVMATHWTSRVSDSEGAGRDHYAKEIYQVYEDYYKGARSLRANPKVDFLVCGDFNDPPDDESVTKHLHAVGREEFKKGSAEPLLLNLFADKAGGKVGTHFYRGKWMCFDQICVSPGLLDNEGWSCDPATAFIVDDVTDFKFGRLRGTPHRFGNENDRGERGYSDHFPVTVRLKVAP